MDYPENKNRWHIYEEHKRSVSNIGLTHRQYEVVIRAINNAIFDAELLYSGKNADAESEVCDR